MSASAGSLACGVRPNPHATEAMLIDNYLRAVIRKTAARLLATHTAQRAAHSTDNNTQRIPAETASLEHARE